MIYFKLEYIKKNQRLNEHYEADPDWKNKIKKIQNRFSEIIDSLSNVIPNYSKMTESKIDFEWTPFWIAIVETQLEFNLPGENYTTEYWINPLNSEICEYEEEEY